MCDRQYAAVRGSCVFMPGSLTSCDDGVRNGNEEGVDCGGPNCESTCDSLALASVFGAFGNIPLAAVVGAAFAAVVTVVAVVVVIRIKRQQHQATLNAEANGGKVGSTALARRTGNLKSKQASTGSGSFSGMTLSFGGKRMV